MNQPKLHWRCIFGHKGKLDRNTEVKMHHTSWTPQRQPRTILVAETICARCWTPFVMREEPSPMAHQLFRTVMFKDYCRELGVDLEQ